jgi:GT2 family glycosyltransferase
MGNVSAIVPCHDSAGTLERTLDALASSSVRPAQIIVVDDGSTDGTSDLALAWARRSGGVLLLRRTPTRRGAAAARNTGALAASGEHLLFVDSDTVVEPDAIARLRAALERPGCMAAVAQYRDYSLQPGMLAEFQAVLVHGAYGALDGENSPYLGTQCVLIRRRDFAALGGFHERYGGATVEDFAFGCLVRRAGGRICVPRGAWIVHNHRYDLRGFTRNYAVKARDLAELILSGEGRDLLLASYSGPRNLLCLLLLLGAAAGFALGAFWPAATWAALLAIAALIGGAAPQLTASLRRRGPWRTLLFAALYCAVILLGGAGAGLGTLRAIGCRRRAKAPAAGARRAGVS